jgi:hypothetical protein
MGQSKETLGRPQHWTKYKLRRNHENFIGLGHTRYFQIRENCNYKLTAKFAAPFGILNI